MYVSDSIDIKLSRAADAKKERKKEFFFSTNRFSDSILFVNAPSALFSIKSIISMFTVVVVISITLLLLINDSPAHAFSVDQTIAAGNWVYWDYSYYSCISGSYSLNSDTNQLSVYCLDSANFQLFQQQKSFTFYGDCTDKLTAMPAKSFNNLRTGLYFVIKNNNAVFSARVNGDMSVTSCASSDTTDSSVYLWFLVIPAILVAVAITGAIVACFRRRRHSAVAYSTSSGSTNYMMLQPQQPQPMFTNNTTVVEL
jgi:hypothetical protein